MKNILIYSLILMLAITSIIVTPAYANNLVIVFSNIYGDDKPDTIKNSTNVNNAIIETAFDNSLNVNNAIIETAFDMGAVLLANYELLTYSKSFFVMWIFSVPDNETGTTLADSVKMIKTNNTKDKLFVFVESEYNPVTFEQNMTEPQMTSKIDKKAVMENVNARVDGDRLVISGTIKNPYETNMTNLSLLSLTIGNMQIKQVSFDDELILSINATTRSGMSCFDDNITGINGEYNIGGECGAGILNISKKRSVFTTNTDNPVNLESQGSTIFMIEIMDYSYENNWLENEVHIQIGYEVSGEPINNTFSVLLRR